MTREKAAERIRDFLYPECPCRVEFCIGRVPVFLWREGDYPTAGDIDILAAELAEAILKDEE